MKYFKRMLLATACVVPLSFMACTKPEPTPVAAENTVVVEQPVARPTGDTPAPSQP